MNTFTKISLIALVPTAVVGGFYFGLHAAHEAEASRSVVQTVMETPIGASRIPSDPAMEHGLKDQIDRMEKELRRTVEEQKRLAARLDGLAQNGNASLLAADRFVTPPADPVTAQKDAEEEYRASMERLSDGFYSEAHDELWSLNAEQAILDVLNTPALINAQPVAAECRSTLCRVEVDYSDLGLAGDAMEEILFSLGWNTESKLMVVNGDDGNGPVSTVLFLSRDGYALSSDDYFGS